MSLIGAPIGAIALSAATIFAIKGRVKTHEACSAGSALLMVLTVGVAAMAQPLPPNAAAPPATPTVGSSELLVKTVESVDLSAPVPSELNGSLPSQIINKIGKGGDTVRLVGTSRGVKASGGSSSTIGQIVWNGVTAQVNGRKRVVPLDKPLTSQFITRSTSVPSGTEVKAKGDADAIIAAAKKLFDVPAEDTRKAEAKKDDKTQNKATPVGGGGSQNDVAANGYQPATGVMKAEVPDLPVSYGVTTEGCTPRVDEAQGVVIIQSRETKSEGGAVSPTGACSDSETRYQIQKSYASCSDRVDLAGMMAYAQYRKYWTDDQGRTSYLGDCADDTESAFDIVEDKTACTYAIDLDAMMAYEQAEKVYTNRNNQRVTVAPCAHTEAAGMPVANTAAGCTFRHDFTEHVSYQQKRMVYTDPNNSVTAVSECADDPTETYAHVDVRNVCQNLVDQGAGKAWPQRRWQIIPPAGAMWISECEPVQEEATDLVATVDGCETTFFHNMTAGQSFGAQRFYYSFDGTVRTYATECQQSSVTYVHQVETQGYEYNDPQKSAQPKTAIYINTPVGRVDVSPAQVRDGAAVLPYTFVRTQNTEQPDKKYWEGCNAFVPTKITETYKRPDATEVSYISGDGTPTGPVDECTRTTENQIVYAYSQMSPADAGIAWVNFYINGGSPTGWGECNGGFGKPCNATSTHLSLAYNSCHTDLTNSYTLTHFSQAQNRVRTQYPNGGGLTYTSWSNVGGPQIATSIGCTSERADWD